MYMCVANVPILLLSLVQIVVSSDTLDRANDAQVTDGTGFSPTTKLSSLQRYNNTHMYKLLIVINKNYNLTPISYTPPLASIELTKMLAK